MREGTEQKKEGVGGQVGWGEDSHKQLVSYQDHPGRWRESRLERCQGQSRKESRAVALQGGSHSSQQPSPANASILLSQCHLVVHKFNPCLVRKSKRKKKEKKTGLYMRALISKEMRNK